MTPSENCIYESTARTRRHDIRTCIPRVAEYRSQPCPPSPAVPDCGLTVVRSDAPCSRPPCGAPPAGVHAAPSAWACAGCGRSQLLPRISAGADAPRQGGQSGQTQEGLLPVARLSRMGGRTRPSDDQLPIDTCPPCSPVRHRTRAVPARAGQQLSHRRPHRSPRTDDHYRDFARRARHPDRPVSRITIAWQTTTATS